ncbi:monofunctional biosynthetic peptidoglycan transglycosylase [Flavobacterium album]|uniref:Biosynthetic peptidoglycan transglycosylase n=1 Tax=Flavobacterium album TaxID=2175091 RepID=A0A2S1QV26_9FLAO|nr:monofunctional biosynthetic peptidoglycan transglycosylase [Flavobacterium album]AWH84199.1 monofunctional biosynthetic peptidoglycan transglycosylase [Flavobacterium album]
MLRKFFRFLFKVCLWFIVLSVGSVVLFRFIPVPFTPLMVTRALEQKFDGKEMTASHDWVPLSEISPNLQKAVIASEDDTFLTHHGFNLKAIQKAYAGNEKGKRLKGGSTISQQTAKNVFLWQGRSYIRKAFEAYFTVLIELLWSKERIMEVYLNSIEMGPYVYGAQAAAQHWYHKDAANLTKNEAAGIAAILPNPYIYRAIRSSGYTERRKGRIIKLMRYVKLDY